jgi:hypothetical protein
MAVLSSRKDQLKQPSVTLLNDRKQPAEYLLPCVGMAQQSADFAINQSKKDACYSFRRLLQAVSCSRA